MVQSVPGELSLQETSVLTVASNQDQGFVTMSILMKELGYVFQQPTTNCVKNAFNKRLCFEFVGGMIFVQSKQSTILLRMV